MGVTVKAFYKVMQYICGEYDDKFRVFFPSRTSLRAFGLDIEDLIWAIIQPAAFGVQVFMQPIMTVLNSDTLYETSIS